MSIFKKTEKIFKQQNGEVATLLTVFSMLIIGLGLLVGSNVSRNQAAIPSNPAAQVVPNTTQGPSPIPTSVVFIPGEGPNVPEDPAEDLGIADFKPVNGICMAAIEYKRDPIVTKIQIRDIVSNRMMTIDGSVPAISGKGDGNFVPVDTFDAGSGVRVEWGSMNNPNEIIVLGNAGKKGSKTHYFTRPTWLGVHNVDVVFYYDRIIGPRNAPTQVLKTKVHTTAQGGCVQPSATPTLSPTPTVTPTVTPTPTPTVVASCFQPCTTQSSCTTDKVPATGESLQCLVMETSPIGSSGQPGNPGQPGDPIPTSGTTTQGSTGSSTDGGVDVRPFPRAIRAVTTVCQPGETCLCVPAPRCLSGDCNNQTKACTPPPTATPTLSPTPTPAPQACIYKALAFVEVCKDGSVIEDGIDKGKCKNDPTNSLRYDASPLPDGELTTQWAPLNEKQILSGRYYNGKDEKGNNILKNTERLKFTSIVESAKRAVVDKFLINGLPNATLNDSILAKGMSYVLFEDSQPLPNGVSPLDESARNTVRINSKVPGSSDLTDEQYSNMEEAEVTFHYNKEKYRPVKDGNKLYSCINKHNGKSGITACDLNVKPSTDQVAGLTVGCGQEIIYGLTLQECDFNYDYLFVVDTSSSMTDPADDDRNHVGPDKLAAVEEHLSAFISAIPVTGKQSRVAIIDFNNGIGFDLNNVAQLESLKVIDYTDATNQSALQNAVKQLRKRSKEGTCIECGLTAAKHFVENKRGASPKNRPVVILLSDGNPNSFPRITTPLPRDPKQATINAAENLKNSNPNLTFVTVGYGNINSTGTDKQWFEELKALASLRKAEGTETTRRWAYSTDVTTATAQNGNIGTVMTDVQAQLNSCKTADLAERELLMAKDIDGNGIINTIDLRFVYDNYLISGNEIKSVENAYLSAGTKISLDVNKDGKVNSLDVSLIISDLGTVIREEEITTPSGGLTTPGQLETGAPTGTTAPATGQ